MKRLYFFIIIIVIIFPIFSQQITTGKLFSMSLKEKHREHSETEIKSLNGIIPDFRVNELAGPSGADQYSPSIAADNTGNFIVTWSDERNVDKDIYAQRYSADGTPIGNNFKVNDDGETADQYAPSIAADNTGNFIVAWSDERNVGSDIYAQRYSAEGTPLGNNFKVNDDGETADQYAPSIAADNTGNFIIAWSDERNVDKDIYAQRYSVDGTPLGNNFKVNDDGENASQYYPSIAADSGGNFIIAWSDERNVDKAIYAQRYSVDGAPLGNNFKVSDNAEMAVGYYTSIAVGSNGNFIITWSDERNVDKDIYAQRYSVDGTPLGNNFKVNDDGENASQYYPSIAADSGGDFIITWSDERNVDKDIYAQHYSTDGTPLGNNFKVTNDEESTYQNTPSIAFDGSGNFVIVWIDNRNVLPDSIRKTLIVWGDYNVVARRFFNDGTHAGNDFKVNDDLGSGQYSSSIAVGSNGNFIITWVDERYRKIHIYAQQYSSDGLLEGSNFKVNDDESILHCSPSIAIDGNENFIITWTDFRNGCFDIYVQQYNREGDMIGNNFKVNSVGGNMPSYSSIATVDNGNFIISWNDSRNGDYDIYAQRYLSDGTPIGNNFKVNDDEKPASQYSSSIAADSGGNFIITWRDHRNGDYDIYGQRYLSDGTPIGNNFKVNDNEESTCQRDPSIAATYNGVFMITWRDARNGDSDIYAQRYLSDGTPLGNNFKVNDDEKPGGQFYPSIAVDNGGNFIITWSDERNGDSDIYAQRYNNGSPIGDNFRVTNIGYRTQKGSDVKLCNNKIYNTWTDNRTEGTGYDIWANVLDWNDPEGIENNEQLHFINEFILNQNYPNPFNPKTVISYRLPVSSIVNLDIYNTLGQKVTTLVSKMQSPGHYQIEWNAEGFTSGIYFYRLKAGDFMQTKKLLLVK